MSKPHLHALLFAALTLGATVAFAGQARPADPKTTSSVVPPGLSDFIGLFPATSVAG